ncbi:helix-turn-helix domain-containing protein [Candidatus Parcubacteria bacterium]|nr:MAG: helix-turn-helix domain-containing protein [Candidatus Parcubacteria bacterium]
MPHAVQKAKETFTVPEVARMVGVSRIAIFKKIQNGQIRATKVGRIYAIPKSELSGVLGVVLSKRQKETVEKAVDKTVKEYRETLRLLGDA